MFIFCYQENLSTTLPIRTKSITSRSEQRLNSIRKSIRRKGKRETHHEVEMKKASREKGVLQVFDRAANWAESAQDLNSSSLAETFLPEVIKRKKEQEVLHKLPENSNFQHNKFVSTPNISKADKDKDFRKRPVSVSIANTADFEKDSLPPIKKLKGSRLSLKPEATSEKSAEEIFSWLIHPINSEKFFRCYFNLLIFA